MWGREIILVISFALIALGTATKCPKRKMSPVREILCYTSALEAEPLADSICGCTTLMHQHHDVRNLSVSNIVELQKSLKEMHPSLQFVISIYDPEMTLRTSAMVRQEAIAQIIAVIQEVDGVELNVTAGSKERLYNFVKSLKDEMIRKSYDKRIFLALPSKPEDLAKQIDIKELVKYIDLFTLSTDYLTDEDGAFVTFHPSRLMGLFDVLNTDSLVDLISELGAPKQKLMITLPASAYRFSLKNEVENAPRSQTTVKEPTAIDRKQLCDAMNDGEWTVERDEDLTAPYAFQNKTWIAFEDKISVGIKTKYALLRDLAGLAVRNIEDDIKTECEEPLTEEIRRSFTEFRRKSRQAVLNELEDELHQIQFSYPSRAKTSSYRVVRVVDTEGHIRAVRENTQTEFVCRRQGYFVHPKSCNRFYRCVKFNQAIEDYSVFEFDCPAGLSFDERTEVCVWPGSLPQGSPCPGSSEIAPVAPKRFECSQPGYYADPQNCRWFFACMDLGESELMAFEFRCPYGLVFDERRLICEWPWLVPACSESGSAYTRTEYNYGGYTVAGSSSGSAVGGGYITGGLPEYSVTGPSNIDYSKTTGVHGVNFAGSTAEYFGKHTSGAGAVSGGYAGSAGPIGIDYSKPSGYGSTISSIPTYTGSSGIQVGSISPGTIAESNREYSGSSSKIGDAGYTASTGYRADGGYSGGYTGGIATGFSGSATGGYFGNVDGSHLTTGATYTGRPPSYLASSASPGSSVNIRVDSTGSKYDGSANLYTGSGAFSADGYSGSTGTYSGAQPGGQPFDRTGSSFGIQSSHPGAVGGSTRIYEGPTGYSTSGILQGSTSSGRVSATGFGSDVSKSVTSGISSVSGHTIAEDGHFVSGGVSSSGVIGGTSTRTRYDEEGYTVPVFLVHGEPTYPLLRAEDGVRDRTETPDYRRPDFARPSLNVSIFGNEVPTGYDVRKDEIGAFVTGSDVRGTFSGGSTSGAAFNYGNVPGAISSPAVSQGTVLTGGGQPGYIGASGTSGYVNRDELQTVNVESARPGTLIYGSPTPSISVPSSTFGGIAPGISGHTAPGGYIGSSVRPGFVESSTGKAYVSQAGTIYRGGAETGGCSGSSSSGRLTPTGPQGFKTDGGCGIDAGKYSENDLPDYRPTSATLPESIIPGGRIEGGVIFGSTSSQGATSAAPEYPRPTSAVFTPSGFTKTGATRTGITTAILGGGGSFSVSTSERRPAWNEENISEKAFEGNVAGYTKTSSISNTAGLSVTLTPPGYSSTTPPSRVIPLSDTSGYSYPPPGYSSTPPSRVTAQSDTSGYSYPPPGYSSTTPPSRVIAQLDTSGYSYPPPGYSSTPPSRVTAQSDTSGYSYPPPGYSSTTPPSRVIAQSDTSGYSYPPPGYSSTPPSRVTAQSDTSGYSYSPPGYSSTTPPSRVIAQSDTSGYSYPPPGYSSTPPSRVTAQSDTSGYSYPRPGYSSTTPPSRVIAQSDTSGYSYPPPGYSSTPPSRVTAQSDTSGYSYPSPGYSSTPPSRVIAQSDTSGYSYPSPGYSSTTPPSRVTVQSATSGYSYPKPNVQLGINGATSSISPIESNLPISSPRPFSSNVYDESSSSTASVTFGSRIPTQPTNHRFSTPVSSVVYSTESPEIYKTTLFEAAKIPVAVPTVRPVDTGYRTRPSNIPVATDEQFIQQTDSSGKKDYGASLSSEYLPAKPTKPGVFTSTARYDVPATTVRPGITYKRPSSYEGSLITPTTYRPSNYYVGQGFSTASSAGRTPGGGSPTSLGISRDKIDKLITNYDRGTAKYVPNAYNTITAPSISTTSSYEVTTKSPEGKGKVIVKWSDLHPLLLGKLGAECTCKADPFANLRGPVRKLIDSSKGKVDLANYDESNIYVDFEKNYGSSEEDNYHNEYDSFPDQPYKISPIETTTSIPPSSSYLPVSSTTIRTRDFRPTSDAPFQLNLRTGKKLKDFEPPPIAQDLEDDDPDQIINGATDCARPGLFRHPSLCNKFYACHWDQWKKKFTLHIFNCPIHLTFDTKASACNWPSKGPACQADNLLVVVWAVLILAVVAFTDAAVPDPPENSGITTIGSKKLATAADCAGVVAFSATQGSVNEARLVLAETLVDKGVGYAAETGIFTTHCPGLYQFSFAGYGSTDLRLTLKRKLNKSDSWRTVVSAGPNGGSNLVLLDVEAGDQLAVFVESGKISDGATFTGHRVYKR
ncbi:uncharacterized protein LOC114938915 isoform X2 [Nylanderia fulva]|uniref:uncharacterized protein LOC114938915 isoform X2 n=1 Tax=Nylanderia fulva TaxID=613905 RepID=UPI0010FBA4AE|nr:uncharacterized protein LOC114938915 isoform X2 [Nylanderia fulva]